MDCFLNGLANKSFSELAENFLKRNLNDTRLQEILGSDNNKHNVETKRKLEQIEPIVEFEEETMSESPLIK